MLVIAVPPGADQAGQARGDTDGDGYGSSKRGFGHDGDNAAECDADAEYLQKPVFFQVGLNVFQVWISGPAFSIDGVTTSGTRVHVFLQRSAAFRTECLDGFLVVLHAAKARELANPQLNTVGNE